MTTTARDTGARRSALALDLPEAWRRLWPEMIAVTSDNWSEDDYVDDPAKRQLAADVEGGVLTPAVLDEIETCLDRDWCVGMTLDAALVVLAAHDRLERFDPAVTHSRRPRTRIINGVRYIVG